MPKFKYINIPEDAILVSKNKVTPNIQVVFFGERKRTREEGMSR